MALHLHTNQTATGPLGVFNFLVTGFGLFLLVGRVHHLHRVSLPAPADLRTQVRWNDLKLKYSATDDGIGPQGASGFQDDFVTPKEQIRLLLQSIVNSNLIDQLNKTVAFHRKGRSQEGMRC